MHQHQDICHDPTAPHQTHLGLERGVPLPSWLPGVPSRRSCCLLAGVLAGGLGSPDVKLRLMGRPPTLPRPGSAPSRTLPPAAAPPTRCRALAPAAADLLAEGGPLRTGTPELAAGILPGSAEGAAWMLLLLAVLQRVLAFILSVFWLPVSAELLGDSRSPLRCLGGESK